MKHESIAEAHIAELTRQRDLLAAQVIEMRALIQSIPTIILNARLDALQGIQTRYDYTRHANACKLLVA